MLIGAHMSIAGGVSNAPLRGAELGCTAIQIFTKNASQWKAARLTPQEAERFKSNLKNSEILSVVAHDSYLINLASPNPTLLKRSREAFITEMDRCRMLNISYLITHPGSHRGSGEKDGVKRIAESINHIYSKTGNKSPIIALETTAGQGNNLGYRFEQIASVMELLDGANSIAICLDLCHIFAAGYDIRTEVGYQKVMKEFDSVIGMNRLKIIHLNDSRKECGSRIDRHEHIGKGCIGLEGFKFIMNDERFVHLPKLLETPKGPDGKLYDKINIARLKSLIQNREILR